MEDFSELACRRCFEDTVVKRRRLAIACRMVILERGLEKDYYLPRVLLTHKAPNLCYVLAGQF